MTKEPRDVPARWKIEIGPSGVFPAETVTVSVQRWPWGIRRWIVSEDRAYHERQPSAEVGVARWWRHWTRSGALERGRWLVGRANVMAQLRPPKEPA